MTVKVSTPCMITCIKELNQPRYLSVGGAFEAYSKPLVTMTYETLKDHPLIDKSTIGLAGSPTNILTSLPPSTSSKGGERIWLLTVLISARSRTYGCSASSVRAR